MNEVSTKDNTEYRQALAAIEKVREYTTGYALQLPQVCVVGDQSSGKSSLLESLCGKQSISQREKTDDFSTIYASTFESKNPQTRNVDLLWARGNAFCQFCFYSNTRN